jgi:hypothetical protein
LILYLALNFQTERHLQQHTKSPENLPAKLSTSVQHTSKVKALVQVDDTESGDDKYSRYIKEGIEWVQDQLPGGYPNLSQIRDIPDTSADVEPLFSSSGVTLEDCRNGLGPELLEALECLSRGKISRTSIY